MATNLPRLELSGPAQTIPSDELLDAAERSLGIRLPPSYRVFSKRYGYGLTGGLFMIYVPMDRTGTSWSSPLPEMSAGLKRELQEAVDGKFFNFAPDGSADLVARLVPFAGSENGHILGWDPGSPSSDDGELWIYVVGARKDYVHKAAPDLADFLERGLQENTGGVLPRASFSLDPTFEPRPGRG